MTPARRGRRARTERPWHRSLWGVRFTSTHKPPSVFLIGRPWHWEPLGVADGEPSHPLLFTSRRLALEWIDQKRARQPWSRDHLAVVRVRNETTEQLAPARKRGRKGKRK